MSSPYDVCLPYAYNQSGNDAYNYTNTHLFYNMSEPFITWLNSFAYNYNATIPFTDWLSTFVYNYNQSLADAYNYTNTHLFYNMSQTIYNYNMSDGSYNSSYAQCIPYAYNATTPAIEFASLFNKTYTDTLYAVLNYGDEWNKTYADTLYAGIEFDYNMSDGALNTTYIKRTGDVMTGNLSINTSYSFYGNNNNAYIYYNGSALVIKVT
jgi:hypothetical protein